ncbi:hypothetical protein [Bradyrhizobium sp. SZCCHNRI1003]|uniref:hypothetical protein n=1 Tax=Bradyrhizobium sp. SZCCHNRI1003 TaxID=3057275 RepID=UPI0029170DC0|nr:hypothetical protein [Bradyrhizobium sp. SZCCHNRI1003]
MATTPQFVATPQVWMSQLTAANTARDGSGTLVTLVTGAASPGTRIDKIRIMGVGTVTAGMIRFFLASAGNTRLIKERPVAAVAPSGSVAGFEDEWTLQDGLYLPSASWSLLAAPNNAETFNVFAYGGNL